MKKKIVCFGIVFSLYLSMQAAVADSVDVFVPQREVTMHSSTMAKNFDNAARKVKESYSKDSSKTSSSSKSSSKTSSKSNSKTNSNNKKSNTNKSKNNGKMQQNQQRRYTSEWT